MGSEALSKVARRDIRRAFAPEASEEVLKFVDGIRQEIATDKAAQYNAAQYNATKALNKRIYYHVREIEHLALKTGVCFCATFGQRLRWLVTGFSTVVIQCQCEAKTVLVLQGKDNPCVCPNCRKGFAIATAGKLEVGEVILPVEDEDVH